MAIYRLLQNSTLGPDEIKCMTDAYEHALLAIGLTDRSDPITENIARKIMAIAEAGERRLTFIAARALKELGISPRSRPPQLAASADRSVPHIAHSEILLRIFALSRPRPMDECGPHNLEHGAFGGQDGVFRQNAYLVGSLRKRSVQARRLS